jgi:hypothetical protein
MQELQAAVRAGLYSQTCRQGHIAGLIDQPEHTVLFQPTGQVLQDRTHNVGPAARARQHDIWHKSALHIITCSVTSGAFGVAAI